jgi:hypothetical protein
LNFCDPVVLIGRGAIVDNVTGFAALRIADLAAIEELRARTSDTLQVVDPA